MRILLSVLHQRSEAETASDHFQVDLSYAVFDIDVQGNIGVPVALLREPLGVDLAKSSLGFRLDPTSLGSSTLASPTPDSGHDVHEVLAWIKEDLLLKLNSRISASEAPTKLFEEQRDAVTILRANLNHPTVPSEDSLELLQVLRRPMARTLRRELKETLQAHADGNYRELISDLRSFVTRYELSANGNYRTPQRKKSKRRT